MTAGGQSTTLPLSARVRSLFPTAYESPRVRFTLVDGRTRKRLPGWVVREHRYVYGLRDWYKANELMPGSLLRIQRGENPGEVIIEAKNYRATKDWVRTVIVGADGGLVFAMLKQPISAEFNDRMAFAIPSLGAVDQLWLQNNRRPFEKLVADNPSSSNAYLNYGFAYVDKIPAAGSITQVILANTALSYFSKSIELKPSWIAYYTRGNSYLYWPKIFGRAPLGIAAAVCRAQGLRHRLDDRESGGRAHGHGGDVGSE